MLVETAVLHPNPSPNGVFNLKPISGVSISEIRVVSMAGQVVHTQTYPRTIGTTISFDLGSLASGVYLIQLVSNGSVIETKRALKL